MKKIVVAQPLSYFYLEELFYWNLLYINTSICAELAQLAEQYSCKVQVVDSISTFGFQTVILIHPYGCLLLYKKLVERRWQLLLLKK